MAVAVATDLTRDVLDFLREQQLPVSAGQERVLPVLVMTLGFSGS